jgi:hypothetical protein
MNRDECISVFRKNGFNEEMIVNMVVNILGSQTGSMIELKNLPMKAFLNTNLEIVYNGGKRYGKLEEAIKSFATM